jgi:hypothetical protein
MVPGLPKTDALDAGGAKKKARRLIGEPLISASCLLEFLWF